MFMTVQLQRVDMVSDRFNIVDEEDIRDGRATDAYFERTEEALDEAEYNPYVVAEVTADQFGNGEFEILSGVQNAIDLLSGLDADLDVDTLPPGCAIDGGPVMRIMGNYREFARYETAILGFLSHASGIATNAARAVNAANGEASVLSFGARHVHPAMGNVVERNAVIGGVDGFSFVAAEDELDGEASGTMPHALMLSFGYESQETAWEAFNNGVSDDVPRIALCDTFADERQEVVRALETFGDDLDGVRLDTTGSRRGDFRHIIKEVRWALKEKNREDVDIYVSGGLEPSDIESLRDVVDGFGIGSYISTAEPVDFSLDIVVTEGNAIAKRGKLSDAKSVYRTEDNGHLVLPMSETPPTSATPLFQTAISDGTIETLYTLDDAVEMADKQRELLD